MSDILIQAIANHIVILALIFAVAWVISLFLLGCIIEMLVEGHS